MTATITAADITVLAPDFYTSHHNTRYLRTSAASLNVPITFYGTGEPYRGWLDVQIHRLLDEIKKVNTDYVLYTDSSDAIFIRDLDDVAFVLRTHTPEIVMSVEADGGLCAGGWLAKTGFALDALTWLGHWSYDGDDGNPQTRWREAVKEGCIEVTEDAHRHIFQVADEPLEIIRGQRPVITNLRTRSLPCVLHFAGGYTDPMVGKADRIKPIWQQLGYEEL